MKASLDPISSTEDGILTRLFRKILFETGFINSLEFFINRYINSGGKKNKATIKKIIINGEMTWKSFIFLIFEILRFRKMTITLKLEHESGKEFEHSLEIKPIEKEKNKRVKRDKRKTGDSNKNTESR